MDERIRTLLERQTDWQESRQKLSWEEKIRMIERVREDFAQWLSQMNSSQRTER